MKIETQISIANYIKEGKLDFSSDKPIVIVTLTRFEITSLINTEYGIRSKRQRTIKKYLAKLLNDLFKEITKDIANENLAN